MQTHYIVGLFSLYVKKKKKKQIKNMTSCCFQQDGLCWTTVFSPLDSSLKAEKHQLLPK